MVAIPNHHFFKWTQQLENSGFDVYWFDVSSNGVNSPQIPWVKQFTDWKLKWDFPLRSSIKKKLPKLYKSISNLNETDVNTAFNSVVNNIKPDIIHCFEMRLTGLPLLNSLQKMNIPLVYSSWGSDMFYFEKLGTTKREVFSFLSRVNYLITDCNRDFNIAKQNGFKNTFLGVFPGNGGLFIPQKPSKVEDRKQIILKGYQYDVGEAIQILKAIELLPKDIQENYTFLVYSADIEIINYIKASKTLSLLSFNVLPRHLKVLNEALLNRMSQSIIHIGNNISDGMPNTMLEAMSRGCFPIQSNPGNASAEVIQHGINGFLIEDVFDAESISNYISSAISDKKRLIDAAAFNYNLIAEKYNREQLKLDIVDLYSKLKIR